MLTTEEREIVNRAMEIMMERLAYGASLCIRPAHYKGCNPSSDVDYFDSQIRHHPRIPGDTFADKLNACYEIEANMPTPETLRAEKIAALRRELDALEGGEA